MTNTLNAVSLRQAPRPGVGALVALCLSCQPAWSLDLSQAYEAALEQDASYSSARAATDARRERIPQAMAQLLPNLSASVSHNNNQLESTSPNFLGTPVTTNTTYGSGNTSITLRQPIFRKYQFADLQQARAQVNDANAVLERETKNLAIRVSGAYFEALQAGEQLALVLAQKKTYTTQLESAKRRYAAGVGTRTDGDEAQAALDLNYAQELEARQNVDFTRRQLQSMTNRPLDSLAQLDASKLVLARPDPEQVEEWIARAEASSPEVESLTAQLEAAGQEVEKAKAGHYPTLDAIAQWSRSESENVTSVNTSYTNRVIGFQLNVPIYAGGYVNSIVRQAVADQERAKQALEALRRDLGMRIHREFRGVTEGVLKVRAMEQAVRSTEQVAVSNRRSFEAGSRTLIDTLNAEQQRVAALRDLSQARFVYLLSRIRLDALAGGTTADVIKEINGWLQR